MKTLAKWLAIGTLATALFSLVPQHAVAQDEGGQVGFDDPTAMAAPPAQFIAPADIKKMMDNKDTSFQLVDTQPEEAFAEGHIPGAINYPWVQQVKPPIPLPRNKMLVLYCPCNHDEDSTRHVQEARRIRLSQYENSRGWLVQMGRAEVAG